MDVLPLLLSDREAAEMLRIGRATFWRLVKAGTLPKPVKLGGATRWRRDEVVAAVDAMTTQRDAA